MSVASYLNVASEMDQHQRQILALESYQSILAGVKHPGPFLREVLAVSIESVDPGASYFDIKEGSGITFKAAGKKIIDLGKKIWKLFLKLLDVLRSFYVKFSGSIARVRKAQIINTERLSKLGSKSAINLKVKLTNIERLSVDSKFKGFDLPTLADLLNATKFFIKDYPKATVEYVRKTNRAVLNLVDKDTTDRTAYLEAFFANFDSTFGSIGNVEKYNMEGRTFNRGPYLPGNRCFVFPDSSDVKKRLTEAKEINIADIVKVDFISASLNVPDDRDKEFDVPRLDVLKTVNDKLGEILSIAEDAKRTIKDFDNLGKVVQESIKEISEKDSLDNETRIFLMSSLTGIVKQMGKPDIKYVDWLAVTVHVYILLIRKCIELYSEAE